MPSTKSVTAAFVARQAKRLALLRASRGYQTIPVDVYARTKAKKAPRGQKFEAGVQARQEILFPDPVQVQRAYPSPKVPKMGAPLYKHFPKTPSPAHVATLIRSEIGTPRVVRKTLARLGLTTLHHSIILKNSPLTNGALARVKEHVQLLPLRIVAVSPKDVENSMAMHNLPGYLAPNGVFYLLNDNPPFYLKPFVQNMDGSPTYPVDFAEYQARAKRAQELFADRNALATNKEGKEGKAAKTKGTQADVSTPRADALSA